MEFIKRLSDLSNEIGIFIGESDGTCYGLLFSDGDQCVQYDLMEGKDGSLMFVEACDYEE